MKVTQFKQLSSGRKLLIRAMQKLGFGRVEHLEIKSGEPVFEHPPRLVKDIRLGSNHGSRDELESPDFPLKAEVLDLFGQLDGIASGMIDLIEVQHGLPRRLFIVQ